MVQSMICIPNELTKNFKDPAVRRKLMAEYADCHGFYGQNEDGEIVWVSISSTQITVATYQKNGWVRVNYYDENGLSSGEAYNGRWNKHEDTKDTVYILLVIDVESNIYNAQPYKTLEAAAESYRLHMSCFDSETVVEDEPGRKFHVKHNDFGDDYICMIQERVIC